MSTGLNGVPPDVAALWSELDYEVTWLHGRWQIYRQLFGTDEERVEILNRSAGTFAQVLQNVLLDDVQLGLAKLGDPAQTGRFKNLTVTALVKAISTNEPGLEPMMTLNLSKYQDKCDKIRARRNKHIAHFDHETMVNRHAVPLTGPSREEIEMALFALRELMNAIQLHFNNSQTAYEIIILESDGDHLIAMLKRGIRYQQLVRSGAISVTDLAEHWSL
ncbi:hypothetical protein ACFPN2_06495 [Steroidobacter flavus]|uniref:HEPN AbiU2-like domain-containing protein n=1 Tax=Steroidobacter flavus TaxID=1842136 RepID=A0ABV8SN26_9GAMM